MKISLCMIVKNEEENLPGCLESVRGLVDEIIVVDTGSTDGAIGVAESFGARVFSYPWAGDFSAARNESLRHSTGDWILFLDADERLDTAGQSDCLRTAASVPGIDAYCVKIFNRGADGKANSAVGSAFRFFRKLPGISFTGRVHEGVDRFLGRAGIRAAHAAFVVDHYGYGQDAEKVEGKYKRNQELLETELALDPNNVHALYHLGLTHIALKREDEAQRAFERALLVKGLDSRIEAMILNMKAYLHLRAGEPDAALPDASRSFDIVPDQNTGRLLKGLALFQKREFDRALPLLLDSFKYISIPPTERQSDLGFEDTIDGSDLMETIGACFSETGGFKEAVPFLKMVARTKKDPAVLERLGICLLNTGNFAEAASCLQKATAAGASPVSLGLPLAFAFFRTGDYKRASEYFMSSRPSDPAEISVAFQLIQAMAADKGFRPYLKGCVESKRGLFTEAFPEDFLKLIAKVEPGRLRVAPPGRVEG